MCNKYWPEGGLANRNMQPKLCIIDYILMCNKYWPEDGLVNQNM